MGSFNPGQGQVHLPAIPSVHTPAQQRLVSLYPSYFHNVCVPPGQAAVRPFQPTPCPGQPPFLSTPSLLAPVQHRLVYHHPTDFHSTGTPLSQGEARSLLPPPIPNHTHETQPICAGIYQIPKIEEQKTDTPPQHVSPTDFHNADASPVHAEARPFHYPLFQNHSHGESRICAGIHQIPELEEQTDPPAQHVSHTDFHNNDASPVHSVARSFHYHSFPTYTHEEDQICAGIRQIPKHNEQTESSDEEIPSPGTIGGMEICDSYKSTTTPWKLTESRNNSTQNHSTRRYPSRTEKHQQSSHADIIISQLNALKGTEIKVKTSYCESDCRNDYAIFKIPESRYHIEVSFDYDFEKGMRCRNTLYIKGRLEFDEVEMKQYVRAKSERELTTWPSQRSHYIPLFLVSESIQIVHSSDNRPYSATASRNQRSYSKHQK